MARANIFIADNHRQFLEVLKRFLGEEFDIVGTAENGKDVVEKVCQLHPDLIVAEITMPGAVKAYRRLQEMGSQIKFVFLTIHGEPEYIEACKNIGAYGYVLKNKIHTHLIPAIKQALGESPSSSDSASSPPLAFPT